MANCPNCGSSHIQLKRETNVNWGRTVAGWALFGVVGGAVGAVTGEDRNANACLDCGTSWKATDLFKTLQTIKNLTGETLDLAREKDRLYMNNFMSEVGSSLEAIPYIEKKANNLVSEAENNKNESAAKGCSFGCLTSIGGCVSLASTISSGNLLWLILLPPLIGYGVGALLDRANKKVLEQKVERAKLESERIKAEAERDFRNRLDRFVDNNFL
jgi:hypothetical protein